MNPTTQPLPPTGPLPDPPDRPTQPLPPEPPKPAPLLDHILLWGHIPATNAAIWYDRDACRYFMVPQSRRWPRPIKYLPDNEGTARLLREADNRIAWQRP